jgi:hypothetical protein
MTQQATFIYGNFRWPPGIERSVTHPLPPPPEASITSLLRLGQPDIGVEILREYGASELRGKLYSWRIGGWNPIEPSIAERQIWYLVFQKHPKNVLFEMQSTGAWEIVFFRAESDANGSYMAVTLRYLTELPPWYALTRKR